jgi:glycerol kinase
MFITIDQSTSATKALLFDHSGQVQDRAALEHKQYYPQPGWVEHDAEEIYQNTLQVLRKLVERNQQATVDCLSITNQRETIVVFERNTGKPLHPAIVWQCRRGEAICSELSAADHDAIVQQKTGLKIDTYFPASKLTWLQNNVPEIKAKLDDGTALIGTIDTYLVYRLTGGQLHATDYTNASRTLLFNIHTLDWDDELCALFGVPRHALPAVYDSTATYGQTGFASGQLIPICGVMGDSHAALFAERCFNPGQAKVTFGTGSSVLLNIGATPHLADNGIVTTIGWVHEGAVVYAFEGITNFTGGTIEWLRNQLQLIDTAQETETLAASVDSTDGVYMIPAFVGLSAPYWKPNARAAIVGMSAASTKAHIVRAALEAIAFRIRDVLDLMGESAGISLETVHGNGGMVQNQFLMQLVADITQLDLQASDHPDISALGAALAGGLGMGIYASLDDIQALQLSATRYQPRISRTEADTQYNGWLTAVQQVIGD